VLLSSFERGESRQGKRRGAAAVVRIGNACCNCWIEEQGYGIDFRSTLDHGNPEAEIIAAPYFAC